MFLLQFSPFQKYNCFSIYIYFWCKIDEKSTKQNTENKIIPKLNFTMCNVSIEKQTS